MDAHKKILWTTILVVTSLVNHHFSIHGGSISKDKGMLDIPLSQWHDTIDLQKKRLAMVYLWHAICDKALSTNYRT